MLMNFDKQDRQLRSLVARASSPCCGQASSLSYHFLVGSRITDFVRQISLGPTARDLSNRTRGVVAEARTLFRTKKEEVSNEVLVDCSVSL
jgi:hypothetical protein